MPQEPKTIDTTHEGRLYRVVYWPDRKGEPFAWMVQVYRVLGNGTDGQRVRGDIAEQVWNAVRGELGA